MAKSCMLQNKLSTSPFVIASQLKCHTERPHYQQYSRPFIIRYTDRELDAGKNSRADNTTTAIMSEAPPPININIDDMNSESSLQTFASDIRSALDHFRENWQRELTTENVNGQHQQSISQEHDDGSVRQQQQQQQESEEDSETQDEVCALPSDPEQLQKHAESLFRKAVELEQRGKVYDALPYYRKAIQIVPDIEFKFYEQQKLLNSVSSSVDAAKKAEVLTTVNETKTTEDEHDDDDDECIDDLLEKFGYDLCSEIYGGKLLLSNRDAGVISTELHISDLPPEMLIYILRWVVSTQLDMRSLEQCSAVSKGMYLCARDEELWRLACKRVWGHNLGTLNTSNDSPKQQTALNGEPVYYSWREMFQHRERVHFNGCYISKTTYLRMGENSFQDQYYRPVQLVEYYRYIRFLPDGKVFMMTNADEPAQGVTKLKQLHNLRSEVLRGHYRLCGDRVTLWLHKSHAVLNQNSPQSYTRQRRGSFLHATAEDANSTQYIIEFRIISTPKRRFVQLAWLLYSIVQKRNKVETTSEFDMVPAKYPPLWFSPVRSYHLDADAPLT